MWCSGNTSVSKTEDEGSIPSTCAKKGNRMRLVTFGCSITHGQGLKDTWPLTDHFPGDDHWLYHKFPKPSVYAWPQVLADKIDCVVDNLGDPGASPKQIAHTVLQYNFEPNDIVIVMWSYPTRTCIISDFDKNAQRNIGDNKLLQMGTWYLRIDKKITNKHYLERVAKSKIYYENIYDDTDANISFAKDILFTYQYLNSLNVKNYHIVPKDEYRFKYKWYNIDKLLSFNVQDIRMQYPKALDNQHPDEQAQQAIAEAIYNEIVNDVT